MESIAAAAATAAAAAEPDHPLLSLFLFTLHKNEDREKNTALLSVHLNVHLQSSFYLFSLHLPLFQLN